MSVETVFGGTKPKQLDLEEKEAFEKEKKKKSLESRTKFLSVVDSEALKNVLDLIQKKLTDRIQVLINDDPEAVAYVNMLQEFGLQKSFAAQAAKELEDLYLNIKDE